MKNSYDSKFKSRVALEALRGELTIVEIVGKYQIHPNLVQHMEKETAGECARYISDQGGATQGRKAVHGRRPDEENRPSRSGGRMTFYEMCPLHLA